MKVSFFSFFYQGQGHFKVKVTYDGLVLKGREYEKNQSSP